MNATQKCCMATSLATQGAPPLSVTKCYWALLSVTGRYWALLGVTEYSRMLPSVTERWYRGVVSSDALAKDVLATADFVSSLDPSSSPAGARWHEHIKSGKWLLPEGFYWAQPNPMWDMPKE
eukprot:8198593-Pyramimonas_sp.AAC.1